MADDQSDRPRGTGSWLRRYQWWLAGAACGALLLGLLIFAAMQVTGVRIYTDERTIRLTVSEATPRSVLWTEPQRLGEMFTTEQPEYEPTLSADGDELFFVRGLPGRGANIYFSRRARGEWSTPRPVEAVNSDFDDLGPRLSADGSVLLFYSNRPGGVGDSGYDIWASKRGEEGWSEPFNLGPNVNSPYNEYSPALTPDGRRLFFASDRRIAEAEGRQPMWQATIRHMGGPTGFDIFMAEIPQREDEAAPGDEAAPQPVHTDEAEGEAEIVAETDAEADPPQPSADDPPAARLLLELGEAEYLEALSSDYHEGACAVSPMGDFLYFSSNRPGGYGGFDIYRARLHVDGRIGRVENLGRPVNSEANETDPFPAMNGFRLYFSSDRAREPGHYDLFSADASEVYRDREGGGLPTLGWSWWLLLPALLLLLALLPLLMNDATYRRLSLMQKCVLLSLLAHLLMLVLMSAVMVGMEVMEHVWERPEATMTMDLDAAQQVEMTMQVRRQRGEVEAAEPGEVELSARGRPAAVPDDAPRLTDHAPPSAQARPTDSMVAIARTDPADTPTEPTEAVEPIAQAAAPAAPAIQPARPDHTPVRQAEADQARPADAQAPTAPQLTHAQPAEPPPATTTEPATPTTTQPRATPLTPQAQAHQPARREQAETPAAVATAAEPIAPAAVAPIEPTPTAQASEAALDTPALAEAAAGRREPTTRPQPDRADVPEPSLQPQQTARQDRSTAQAPAHAIATAEPERTTDPDAAIAMGAPPEVEPAHAPATTAEQTTEADPADPAIAQAETQPRQPTPAADHAATEQPRPDPLLDEALDPARLTARSLASPARRELDATAEMPTERVELDTPATQLAASPTIDLDAPEATAAAVAEADPTQDITEPVVEPGTQRTAATTQVPEPDRPDADAGQPPVDPARPRTDSLAAAAEQAPRREHEAEQVFASAMDAMAPEATLSDAPTAATTQRRETEADADLAAAAVDAPTAQRHRREAPPSEAPARPSAAEADFDLDLDQRIAHAVTGLHAVAEPSRRGNPHQPESADDPAAPGTPVMADGRLEPHLPADRLARRSEQTREMLIEQFGGTPESEAAVDLALAYLDANQEPDGRWTHYTDDTRPGHRGEHAQDTGITGLAVLCFLGANHTPERADSPYRETVEQGLEYLLAMQEDDGDLRGDPRRRGGSRGGNMYCHAIAALALAEAALMTGDPRYRKAAFRAGRFIADAQHERTGGWRYNVGDDGDTTVLAWQVLALYSIQQLGQPIPEQTREGAVRWLDHVGEDVGNILPAYRRGQNRRSAPIAAQGGIARLMLGQNLDQAQRNRLASHLLNSPPGRGRNDFYYWYYASLTMIQLGGEPWEQWNEQVRDHLVDIQETSGDHKGSWNPRNSRWGSHGGRIYSTAMATLTLEVYYRHLPLFQQVQPD